MVNIKSKNPLRIGLVGGVSWTSTAEYYRRLHLTFAGSEHPGIVLVDLNFKQVLEAQELNLVDRELELVSDGISRTVNAGGEIILVCSNTTSRTLKSIGRNLACNIVNVIDCVSEYINRNHFKECLLVGTRYTMERDFYRSALLGQGRVIRTPEEEDRIIIHDMIYNELCMGKLHNKSVKLFTDMLYSYTSTFPNLDSIILGCTELSLLGIKKRLNQCVVIDTISTHIERAVQLASGT
ncbi:amino acid racemase [Mesorhizobium sp. M0018]|uniref:aspartate/glutamate racemase family protein n=1 Tax=Mesorhizobium sp. M0018 TaxID=2956844 RepID=UPI0033355D8B